jgi:hypothetical protein
MVMKPILIVVVIHVHHVVSHVSVIMLPIVLPSRALQFYVILIHPSIQTTLHVRHHVLQVKLMA